MKRYITFVLAAVALVGVTSCSIDNGIATPDGEGQMALRFESSSMTRATVDGIDDLNENLIKTIDCYFYPASATEDTPAVWYQQFTFGTDGAGVNTTASVTDVLMPSGNMNAVFGSGTTGKIYAIANYAGGAALPTSGENTTVAKLKDMVVTTAWLDNKAFKEQTSFVMDSEMTTITKAQGNAISGKVPLNRTAAKVELTITGVEDAVSSTVANADGTTTTTWWVPAIVGNDGKPSGAYVTMYNARTAAGVGGAPQAYSEATSLNLESYGFSSGSLYKQTNPFYTYPHSWSTDDEKASLLLVVYWQATDKASKDDDTYQLVGDAQPCYYEIPIGPADNTEILRNRIYQIGINVGTLGSFVKEDPVQLTPRYMVVNWGSGNISANIKGQQYLVVDEKKVVVNNVNEYSVAYASSSDVTAVITSVTKPNYSGREAQITTIYDGDGVSTVTPNSGNRNPFSVSISNGKIKLTHVLVNDNTSSSFDYVPYTVKVQVTNKDGFTEEIEFVQYPEMYIEVCLNTDYNNDNSVNGNVGYAWVNNSRSTLGNLNGYSTSNNNSNPNMIVITTTALGSSSDFIIGDPRVSEINNLNYNNWASASDINGTTRKLLYYYPTNTSDAAADVVAPRFRIASSYGLTSAISFANAQYRCASYQEDGYPAGRWRVPTAAELEYIVQLSASGYITILFNNNGDYWAADGTIYVPNYQNGTVSQGSGSSAYVRCVYDDWYWGSERLTSNGSTTLTSFTWGDQPR